jgi:hypothetical protein
VAEHGPLETEQEASQTEAARAVYAAFDADPGPGKMRPHNLAMLTAACEAAGVDLGAYDRRTLEWLAGWEPGQCAALAGIIRRAAASEGSVTQWGLRLTGESSEPIFDAHPSEEAAREAVPGFQGVFGTVVVRRQVGPWTVAAGTCRHCGGKIAPCPQGAGHIPACLGWIHPAYARYGPVGPHYCGGRSVNPSAEPATEGEDADHG